MIGWIPVLLLAAVAAGAIIMCGRVSRGMRELVGAALLVGLAGYAWQGRPAWPGAPRTGAATVAPFDEKGAERRSALGERFGKSGQWLMLSDGLGRQGKTREAVNVLVSGLRETPDEPNLWLGLGNALMAHGGDILSPSADYAYRRAEQLAPDSPGPLYFHGLALARSGQFEKAAQMWRALVARLPAKSPLRAEVERYLEQIDRLRREAGP